VGANNTGHIPCGRASPQLGPLPSAGLWVNGGEKRILRFRRRFEFRSVIARSKCCNCLADLGVEEEALKGI